MDKEIKIIVPEKKYVGASSSDQNERVFFESDRKDFVDADRNIRVDLAELFNTERQASEKYRLYGKLVPMFSNSYTGTTEYEPLLNSLWLTSSPFISNSSNYGGYPPYNEFAFIRNDVTRDKPVSGNTTIEVVGNKHIEVFPINAHTFNWNTYLSYVFDKDENKKLKYTSDDDTVLEFTASDGIPVKVLFNTRQRICVCESPVDHGLQENEYVLIKGKLLKIDSLGDETYGSEKRIFNIQLSQISGSSITPGIHTFKRVIDPNNLSESTSKYYIHKHKIISPMSDFIVDKCGFENSIFEDQAKLEFENPDGEKEVLKEKERGETLLLHYKKVVERLNYTNNYNVAVNEIYITTVNRNAMGYFTQPKVGYDFNFHNSYADLHFSGGTSLETGFTYTQKFINGQTFYTGNELTTGTTLDGAFVEYNKYELKERIISEASHRFSFVKEYFDHKQDDEDVYHNSSSDNMFGYFYKPHFRIKLKEYSSYIEESTTSDIDNFPKNAIYFLKDKVWRWRELYTHGFIDDNKIGVDYPFINGVHYIKFHIPFYIRSEYHFSKKDKVITPFTNNKYRNGC
jgi:hypothetical protein